MDDRLHKVSSKLVGFKIKCCRNVEGLRKIKKGSGRQIENYIHKLKKKTKNICTNCQQNVANKYVVYVS